jgi:hypothetical protein
MAHDTAPPAAGSGAEAKRTTGWLRRVAWLVAIWGASVAALGVVAYVFRILMGWAGLTR